MPPLSQWPARRVGISVILACCFVWGVVIGTGLETFITPALAQITTKVSGANRKGEYMISGFYSIKSANLTTSSQSFTFGLTASKVMIRTPSGNSDEVCIDWLQSASAVCPAANTSGNTRIAAGTALILDALPIKGINAIAASGTQTVYIDAFN